MMYESGLLGTVACWLVNQHNNFPKYPYRYYKGDNLDDELDTDLICKGSEWDYANETYEQSTGYLNLTTKRCYKTFPEHGFTNESHNTTPGFIKAVKNLNIDYHMIVPICNDMDHLLAMARRWTHIIENGPITLSDAMNVFVEFVGRVKTDSEFDAARRLAKSYYVMDIGKILFDLDTEEYLQLCDHINEQPLTNWKESCIMFTQDLYARYM